MTKFKYLKIKNNQKIRYLSNNYTKNLYVVFLHGFMSDVEGEKPKTFLSFCKKNKIGFLECTGNLIILTFFYQRTLKGLHH